MENRHTGHPIQKHPRGGRNQECDNPITESIWEAPFLQKVNNVFPTNGVEGFADIKLEEKGRSLVAVQPSSQVLYIEEVVVDASSLDEGALEI
jgi:hypothetical protein